MSDKKELVYDLAGALVAILFGCIVVIMIIVNIPGTKEIDGALIASVLTGGVTLFAPVAAYYLLNNWKEQHNATIYSSLAIESLNNLKKLSYSLVSFRDLEENLKEIIKNNFLEQEEKLEAIKNIYENYIENRQELSKVKSLFLHDILFIAQLKNDITLLQESVNITNEIQSQLLKLNEYIIKKKTTKLNNQELLKSIYEDNTVFCALGIKSSKIILPLLQKYIQQ